MKYAGYLSLAVSIILLAIQLWYLDEPVLTFAALFPILFMSLSVALTKGLTQTGAGHNKGRIILSILVLILLVPFGYHHFDSVNVSSWKEVGILLSGQYSVFLTFLSIPILLGVVIASRIQGGDE